MEVSRKIFFDAEALAAKKGFQTAPGLASPQWSLPYQQGYPQLNCLNMEKGQNLRSENSIVINSSAKHIWDVLTNPQLIKLYLFGSNVKTSWHVGSSITFTRDRLHEKAKLADQPIVDKGQVLEVEKEKYLKYTYYSSQEGYADIPPNYSIVSNSIEKETEDRFKLTYLRKRIPIEFEQKNQEKYLPGMLEKIKNLAEQK
jgi:uncharacterized protein YndB with AHSA1/START domain